MKLHLDQHPSFTPGEEDTLEMKLWVKLAENGVLFGPGWMFAIRGTSDDSGDNADPGHFRISFSNAEVRISKSANAFAEDLPEVPRPQESGHNFWTSHPRVL